MPDLKHGPKRNLVEIGVHSTLAKTYGLITKSLVVVLIFSIVIAFFPELSLVSMFLTGISVGYLLLMIFMSFSIKADKISGSTINEIYGAW